jgi:hypothetical protein
VKDLKWHPGPARGGPDIWVDGSSLLIAIPLAVGGYQLDFVHVSTDDGRASMDTNEGDGYCAYDFGDIAWFAHVSDVEKLLPVNLPNQPKSKQ